MRRLILADVHANLPAFQAVLADAGAVDEVLFLGDIVGFGPHPAECVDLLRGLRPLAISGNHDRTALDLRKRPRRLASPVNWEEWTCAQLPEEHFAFLDALPEQLTIESCGRSVTVLHHPAGAPYLYPGMPASELARHFAGVPGSTLYCAHSHRSLERTAGERRIVCFPAVGQPRDGDPRAGYVLEESDRLHVRRVPYDVEAVVQAVRAIPLDPAFTERWACFLRTGFDAEWSRPRG